MVTLQLTSPGEGEREGGGGEGRREGGEGGKGEREGGGGKGGRGGEGGREGGWMGGREGTATLKHEKYSCTCSTHRPSSQGWASKRLVLIVLVV